MSIKNGHAMVDEATILDFLNHMYQGRESYCAGKRNLVCIKMSCQRPELNSTAVRMDIAKRIFSIFLRAYQPIGDSYKKGASV